MTSAPGSITNSVFTTTIQFFFNLFGQVYNFLTQDIVYQSFSILDLIFFVLFVTFIFKLINTMASRRRG